MVEHLYWSVSNGQIFTDQEEITTFPLQSSNYDVQLTVTSPQGCTDSVNFINYLTVYPQPLASFSYSPNPVTMFNTNVQLNNSSVDGDTYAWYIEEGSPNYSEEQSPQTWFPDGQTGEYNVLLITTSVNGCVDSSEQLVVIAPEVICYAPNTFTPDGDEHNQLWRVFIEGIDIYEFNITIFNRWGELIFESHDPAAYWDGSFNGILVQDGVYSWFIEAKDFYNSKKYTFKGHINVLR
jgi:gliding motility-associated-like protein